MRPPRRHAESCSGAAVRQRSQTEPLRQLAGRLHRGRDAGRRPILDGHVSESRCMLPVAVNRTSPALNRLPKVH